MPSRNRRPDFNALVAIEYERGKNRWRQVGAAWLNANEQGATESISIQLDALPLDGRLVLLPPRENGSTAEPEESSSRTIGRSTASTWGVGPGSADAVTHSTSETDSKTAGEGRA